MTLEIMMPLEGRGFESLRLRQKIYPHNVGVYFLDKDIGIIEPVLHQSRFAATAAMPRRLCGL